MKKLLIFALALTLLMPIATRAWPSRSSIAMTVGGAGIVGICSFIIYKLHRHLNKAKYSSEQAGAIITTAYVPAVLVGGLGVIFVYSGLSGRTGWF